MMHTKRVQHDCRGSSGYQVTEGGLCQFSAQRPQFPSSFIVALSRLELALVGLGGPGRNVPGTYNIANSPRTDRAPQPSVNSRGPGLREVPPGPRIVIFSPRRSDIKKFCLYSSTYGVVNKFRICFLFFFAQN